jgi:outer membrane protein TolC
MSLLGAFSSSGSAAALKWEDVVVEAKRGNPDLLQADEALRQAELSELSAKAQFLPRASLNASTSEGSAYHPQEGWLGSLDSAQGGANFNLGLSSSLNLFSGFSDFAALRAAIARRQAATATRAEARANVAFSLRQAFSQLIYAEAQITLSDVLAARAKENGDMVALRYDAGAENKGSALQAKSLASQARFDAERARRQLRSASLSLSRLLGRGAEVDLRAEGSLAVPESPPEPDFGQLISKVPAVLKAKYQAEQANAAKFGAYSPFLPSINASASINRSEDAWVPQNGSWNAGLSLSLPFFSGFSDTLALRQAASTERVAKSSASEALLQARLDLENAWTALVDAVATVELRAESVEAFEARAEIGRAQYAQGLMSFENWDQIESQLSNSRRQALSSHLDAVVSKAAWDKAQGKDF